MATRGPRHPAGGAGATEVIDAGDVLDTATAPPGIEAQEDLGEDRDLFAEPSPADTTRVRRAPKHASQGGLSAWLGSVWAASWRDVAGLGAVFAALAAYIAPAFKDGFTFGTFDAVMSYTSLGSGIYHAPVHNYTDADVASQLETWNLFDWRQIHAGHFPLWNPFSLLGLPQFANFQSSVLSLPDLFSYAVPARFAFFTVIVMKLVIASTGAYVFARVIGLRPMASAFAGVTYALSGGFASQLSWPTTDVLAFVGWMAAFSVLAYRWPGRMRHVAGLAVATAFFFYGGFPEANVCVALFFGVSGAAVAVCLVACRHKVSLRGLGRVSAGLVAGAGLAMPLLLTGAQYVSGSHRQTEGNFAAVPGRALALLVAPSYFGSPLGKSDFALPGVSYYDATAYVGAVVLVLAALALVTYPRHPVVIGLATGTVVLVAVSYAVGSFHPLLNLMNSLGLSNVLWRRARLVIGFPLGILGAIGLESVLRCRGQGRVPRRLLVLSLAGLAVVVGLWIYSSHDPVAGLVSRHLRALVWPGVVAVVCVAIAVLVVASGSCRRPRLRASLCRWAAGSFFVVSAVYLIAAGAGLNTWTSTFYPESPAMRALASKVGSGVVAVDDTRSSVQVLSGVGLYPDLNVAYGITEFEGHDPLLPQRYFGALAPGQGVGGIGLLVPNIRTVAQAREYGISWVLVAVGVVPPAGAVFSGSIAHERLYAVPGAARFTMAPAAAETGGPVAGAIVAADSPYAGAYDVTTDDPAAGVLIARVTDVPGWRATIDGRPAALRPDGLMESLEVPAGVHHIVLGYEPATFETGLVEAGATVALLAFGGAGSMVLWRRRRRHGLWLNPDVAQPSAGTRSQPFEDGLSVAAAIRVAAQAEPTSR